jgi:RNA polymerase-interacting CarD/CdnL/TRCF family regulator
VVLTVGEKVVYPCQGPCLIEQVVKKVIAGRLTRFYRLVVLDGAGGKLFVPVDKAPGIGIRQLLERSEIPKLLGRLETVGRMPKVDSAAKNWRQRTMDNQKMFSSGSAFDLAEIVESLTDLSETKSLSTRDKWALERARKLLVCEISEVMGEAKSAAEEQVDKALAARKER